MAGRGELAYSGRNQTDPILVDFDLARNADTHGWNPQLNASEQIRTRGAVGACELAVGRNGCGRICDSHDILWQNPASMELDRYDRAILRLLQQDARITNARLASEVSLSESACLRRVRALEVSGLIEGYTTLINQQKAGYPVNVFVSITLDRQSQSGLTAFETAVRKIPEVMECYLMTGEHDYLLRIVVADLADFERIHSQHLTRLPSVVSVQSSFAMRTVTRSAELPLR
jgi:Lrp/AsnC family transcriptional regulator, leucine-responsive regulatory protein